MRVSAKAWETDALTRSMIDAVVRGDVHVSSARATRCAAAWFVMGMTTAVERSAPTWSRPSGRTKTRVPDARQIVCGQRMVCSPGRYSDDSPVRALWHGVVCSVAVARGQGCRVKSCPQE